MFKVYFYLYTNLNSQSTLLVQKKEVGKLRHKILYLYKRRVLKCGNPRKAAYTYRK